MFTFFEKIIFILFIALSQFLPDILNFYKTTWLVNYIDFFWFDRIVAIIFFLFSLYIFYISLRGCWPYMKDNFFFNYFNK